jgi:hypothetical protein
MGFNFQGASTTSAHKHSSSSSDGGSLDETTQMLGSNLNTRILIGV